MQQLFGNLYPILDEEITTLERKVEMVVHAYIDMLSNNPDLPLFVLSEIRADPERFGQRNKPAKFSATRISSNNCGNGVPTCTRSSL